MTNEVTEAGSSDSAKDVELRVTYDAANASKQALLDAVNAIKQAILEDTFPPV